MKTNKFYLLIAAVLTFLFTFPPTNIFAQETIIGRLDKSLGVKLPVKYEAKVRELIKNNDVFKVKGADDFTAQFIENEMKADWNIDKQNQLLFLWHSIYKKITKEDLYDGQDGDAKVAEDFGSRIVGLKMRISGQKYENSIADFFDKKNAEYDRQSAEYDRQSAEARQRTAENERLADEANRKADEANRKADEANRKADENIRIIDEANRGIAEALKKNMKTDSLALKDVVKFYTLYKNNPSIVKPGEIKLSKETANWFFKDCEEKGIDYKAILHKEVGDEKMLKEMLKFYGIE